MLPAIDWCPSFGPCFSAPGSTLSVLFKGPPEDFCSESGLTPRLAMDGFESWVKRMGCLLCFAHIPFSGWFQRKPARNHNFGWIPYVAVGQCVPKMACPDKWKRLKPAVQFLGLFLTHTLPGSPQKGRSLSPHRARDRQVLLQNCHLAPSFMPTLESIVPDPDRCFLCFVFSVLG